MVTDHKTEAVRLTRLAMRSETETDTRERAIWRADFVFDAMYDRSPDPDEADQPLRDLLTDLVHWAEAHEVDIEDALSRAQWMAQEELKDWGLAL